MKCGRPSVRLSKEAEEAGVFSFGGLDTILGKAVRVLLARSEDAAANLLSQAEISLDLWNHDNWNGGQDTWRLNLTGPPEARDHNR